MIDFETISAQDLLKEISLRDDKVVIEVREMYFGDHWRQGAGWVGPALAADDPNAVQMLGEVRRAFVSKNVIKEIVQRHIQGILKDEPAWSIEQETIPETAPEGEAPAEDQTVVDPLIAEAENLLQRWWSASQALIEAREELVTPKRALQAALANALLTSRGPMRLFIPADFVDETESGEAVLQTVPLEEAIGRVFLHVPSPSQSAVSLDDERLKPFGVYETLEEGSDRIEEAAQRSQVEVSFLDDDDRTHLMVKAASGEQVTSSVTLDLAGNLMHHEIALDPLISPQVIQMQKLLNMTLTMMGRNVVQGGFLERIFVNAQLPGREVLNTQTGEPEFVSEDLQVGPGVTTYVAGIEYEDAAGNKHFTTPNVIYRDPVDTKTFIETKIALYSAMLEETRQAHVMLSGANLSGESRRQSRADYEASLQPTQSALETALIWVFETVLNLAAVVSGQQGRFAGLNIVVTTFLDTGPLTSEEETSIMKQVDEKMISRKTGRTRLGVRDPDAEEEQIQEEQDADRANQNLNLANALINARREVSQGNVPPVETPGQLPAETPAEQLAAANEELEL